MAKRKSLEANPCNNGTDCDVTWNSLKIWIFFHDLLGSTQIPT